MHYKYIITVFCLLLIICSCTKTKRNRQYLDRAENLLQEYPDSVLMMLDSIAFKDSLPLNQYNRFQLLLIQAKDKAHKDISFDKIIFEVKDYYLDKKDLDNIALASYYCGRVFQKQNNDTAAMREFLDAEKFAKQINNAHLSGLIQSTIGTIYYEQLLMSEAASHYKIAIEYFQKANNKKNEIITHIQLGNACLVGSLYDNAFYYYWRSYDLAEQINDSAKMAIAKHCLSVAYREIGDFDSAINYLKESQNHTNDSTNITKLYLNFSKSFYEKMELDSAKYYVDKSLLMAENQKDPHLLASIYKTLSLIEEVKKEYKQSLGFYKAHADQLLLIVTENKKEEILELQNKYQQEHLENENNRLLLKLQRIGLVFLLILLIISLLTFYFYRKLAKSREINLEKENQILDAERKIYQLTEMARTYDEKSKDFRNILSHHFNILRETALLGKYIIKDSEKDMRLIKRFNEIVYEQESLNWNMFYTTMNELYNGLFDRLKSKYPQLNEQEFRLSCLTYAKFSSSDIGLLLGLSDDMVNKKRHIVRKLLGVEKRNNFSEFLDSQLISKDEITEETVE